MNTPSPRNLTRQWALVVCVAPLSLLVTKASAQPLGLNSPGVGSQYANNYRRETSGINYTVANINQNVLNQSTGIFNGIGVSSGLTRASQYRVDSSLRPAGPAAKPFSGITRRPTVSPYLSLFNESLDDNFETYTTLVRPQLQQQRLNDQLQRQTQLLNQRFQELSARPAFNPQGSEQALATGHPTFFNNTFGFYPTAGGPRRR
ncbi:SlyX family protein [Botrimarina hoheduenensis]|uniref:Uncharacterized protein n=1 Tax=Botrimarina hoheduenensis TaxID=2528000 RepID=A0A5C5W774_9BACT|nr:SlyX family protein [Botrimarina hoheduenensis]TWT46718.1 hypothetical protein Pla111_18190 [Botrimarina hoheduenensis]